MADIISGQSRFNGDKKAPIRRINNIKKDEIAASIEDIDEADSELLDEEDIKLKIRRHRIRVAIAIAIGIAIIVGLVFLIRNLIDNYKYSTFTVVNSTNREDIESSQYEAFADGYARFSKDGAAFFKKDGQIVWNETFSMQKPQFKKCEDTMAIGDIEGSSIYTFNKTGKIVNIDTSMTIMQIEVSKNGSVVAVLEDNYANYINMYDSNGEKVYSVKTTLSGDGYPLDVSVSADGTKLIVSFIQVSGEEIKNNVVFYNFSEVGKNATERVVGGFNYEDTIVGDVQFINDTTAVAIGEDVLSIYRIKEYPSLEKEIKIENEIQKVLFSNQYIGVVVDNSEKGELYKLVVYNTSGNKVFENEFGTSYDNIQFDGKSVIMNNSDTFVLMNMSGKTLATISFDMPIADVLPTGSRGNYILINSKYVQNIKLK